MGGRRARADRRTPRTSGQIPAELSYIDHYNKARPDQGLEQYRPNESLDVVPLPIGPVERRDRLGGHIHEYSRGGLTR